MYRIIKWLHKKNEAAQLLGQPHCFIQIFAFFLLKIVFVLILCIFLQLFLNKNTKL